MSAATARSRKRAVPSSLLEASERAADGSWPRGVSREPKMKIGQVVDLLKVEFPALSISKVRYLEGEGLIRPIWSACVTPWLYSETSTFPYTSFATAWRAWMLIPRCPRLSRSPG